MTPLTSVVLDRSGIDGLITALRGLGYRTVGPVARDGAIVHDDVVTTDDLPVGWRDEQRPGHYRIHHDDGRGELFEWAVGATSWKSAFFPGREEVWRASPEGERVTIRPSTAPSPPEPLALVGARPCEVAAIDVLDRVLADGAYPDPGYVGRRAGAFVVAVECGAPSSSCFCSSMSTGPHLDPDGDRGADVILTELVDDDGHRFVARAGTPRGDEVLAGLSGRPVADGDWVARDRVLDGARELLADRVVATDGLAALLARNLDHPEWSAVAERCLSCGNCTSVCPTCFCSDVHDTTEIGGDVVRSRSWSSCFDLDHSYVHGGPVRATTSSRYRQWMTHKLSTWWDQFDTSGCVGCGRCLTWCPVGIDITEEVAVIAASDGLGAT